MNEALLKAIDEKIEADYAALVKDTIHLVNIKSVREEPKPGAPFGEGPRKVLDEVLRWGRERGFAVRDYGVGVISVALQEGQPDLGMWTHGDVVPEGDGWLFSPYDAREHRGCIIGRGATDNKGQLVCLLHLLSIFRELGVSLRYNPALYVGSCEESGMNDLMGLEGNPDARGFLNVCQPPRLSLVPDGSFPVGYCGKGGLNIEIESLDPLNGMTLEAGHAAAPGRATAVLEATVECTELPDCTVTRQGDKTVIETETAPCHLAHPNPEGNMITVITRALLEHALCDGHDRAALDFLCRLSHDTEGVLFGINHTDPDTKSTTVAAAELTTVSGRPRLRLNIRYPLGLTAEEIRDRIQAVCREHGFTVAVFRPGIKPYRLDPQGEIMQALCAVSNAVTGDADKPYGMGGGTYAHCLPNGYVFGTNGNVVPEDFPAGHGGAHGKDESVSVARLQRAMRIYARALLTLNDMSW